MDGVVLFLGFGFLAFCVALVVLTVKGQRDDERVDEEQERLRVHKMLVAMPRREADAWLRDPSLPGARCACRTYNLAYTDVVKTNDGDHQADRCQPARERIDTEERHG